MVELNNTGCGCNCGPSCVPEEKKEKQIQIMQTTSEISMKDRLGMLKVRFGIKRNSYSVIPGLYKLGNPNKESNVFVTSNYKYTFDVLRKNLKGMDAYILVLDTRGVNVWCAAGKGTFGTQEVISKIESSGLKDVVSHRKIILPQLGAPGVAAHEVREKTGFIAEFGPVRAEDISEYIKAGNKADDEMRRVRFNMYDRFILIANDAMSVLWVFVLISVGYLGVMYMINKSITSNEIYGLVAVFLPFVAGLLLVPVLLPFIPGRSFSFKGFVMGVIAAGILTYAAQPGTLVSISWLLLIPAISSYFAMNFTGASTYTSLSGVIKEMKVAVPLQITAAVVGVVLLVVAVVL